MNNDDKIKRRIMKIIENAISILLTLSLFIAGIFILFSQDPGLAKVPNNGSDLMRPDAPIFFGSIINDFSNPLLNGIETLFCVLVLVVGFILAGAILGLLIISFYQIIHLMALPLTFLIVLIARKMGWIQSSQEAKNIKVHSPAYSKFLKISGFLFSEKTQTEVFEQICGDWHEEVCNALKNKEFQKARWIGIRYRYIYIAAILEKSPIGEFIELIKKITK